MPRRLVALVLGLLAVLCVGVLPVVVGHGVDDAAAMTLPSPAAGSRTPPVVPPQPAAFAMATDLGQPGRHDGRRPVAVSPSAERSAAIDSLEPELVLLGSWTVRYVVGPENGDGANVRIPLRHLDGLTIEPGATFDFWDAVGTVSRRTGYRDGGVIEGDHIAPQGAVAGGICTVSTAVFNAAARAGLRIVARSAHGGYLAKYPLGLDAAVSRGGGRRQTVSFRNDTAERIVLRTASDPGIARVDLYAPAPTGRTVEFSAPSIRDRRVAHDRLQSTRALPRGERRRSQPSSDGMTVSISRIVRDASGRVIHRDRWVSRYRPLRGLVLVGVG
jgi:vancomycin resistance protein YoaR